MLIQQCGRQITTDELSQIQETVETFQNLSQNELAHTVCEHLGWHTVSGSNKVDACMKLLRQMEKQGVIRLPSKRKQSKNSPNELDITNRTQPQGEVSGKLSDIGPVNLRLVKAGEETTLFNEYINRYHYLGYKRPFGFHLRYFVESTDGLLGCILFSGAAKALRPRDRWIGWSKNERLRNLGFVVNNGRFLIFPWVKVRYLASHILSKVVRKLRNDWQKQWGYNPVLLETFVDPKYFEGTCYRASNFEHLGMTSGKGLIRDGKSYTTSPKYIFVRPLIDNFRDTLCSPRTVKEVNR